METFSALLAICAGISPVLGEFPAQRPVALSFDVFFDLRLNKRLSKHLWGWWFETLSPPFWRHCNEQATSHYICQTWPIWPMHACVSGPQWDKWSICACAQPMRDDVTSSLIGWVHTQNYPCKWLILTGVCREHISWYFSSILKTEILTLSFCSQTQSTHWSKRSSYILIINSALMCMPFSCTIINVVTLLEITTPHLGV